MNSWDAEHVVGRGQARALLAEQFPERFADLRAEEVVHLADGWDNTVHLVRGEWAVRFPRRAMATALFDREVRLLPALAPRLPLPVPVPQLIGAPAHGFPWPFWGARVIEGTELADAGLPESRAVLAAQVGQLLRALHDPGVARDLGPAANLPHDPMRRAEPAARGRMARAALDRMAARGTWVTDSADDRAVDDLLAEGSALGRPDPTPGAAVLVHGDLHLRHLLVDDDGLATGVIDWGDACLADPAVDLSIAYAAFAGRSRHALLTAYGMAVPPERELRARVLAVSLCAALADYADLDGRPALLAESLAGLHRCVT